MFKSIVNKMTSTYKAGLTLCGAFLIVFCLVRLQDLDGRQSQECQETDWKPLESIADIGGYNTACGLLGRIYRVGVEGSEIRIPGPLGAKLRQWLQEDETLIQQSSRQPVIQITNKVRPSASPPPPLMYILKNAERGFFGNSRLNMDFLGKIAHFG